MEMQHASGLRITVRAALSTISLFNWTINPQISSPIPRHCPLFYTADTMSKLNMELVAHFTEDAVAENDTICQRSACGTFIPKGAPCFYIATDNPSKAGRFVCKSCFDWYSKKPTTTVRTTMRAKGMFISDL